MTRNEITATLIRVMQEVSEQPIDRNRLADESRIEALGFDSLAVLDLLFCIKEEIGIEVEVEDLDGISTIGEIIDLLERRLQAAE